MFSENILKKIKNTKGTLMHTKKLREKIKGLEAERASLMIETVKLKKMAESKASVLESEVSMMREEVKSLRDLLGYTEETPKK